MIGSREKWSYWIICGHSVEFEDLSTNSQTQISVKFQQKKKKKQRKERKKDL